MPERRQHPRIDVDLPAIVGGGRRKVPARLLNISLGGCLLEGEGSAYLGGQVFISFEKGIPLGGFKAKTVWQNAQDGHWRMGVQFQGMAAEEVAFQVDRVLRLARQLVKTPALP